MLGTRCAIFKFDGGLSGSTGLELLKCVKMGLTHCAGLPGIYFKGLPLPLLVVEEKHLMKLKKCPLNFRSIFLDAHFTLKHVLIETYFYFFKTRLQAYFWANPFNDFVYLITQSQVEFFTQNIQFFKFF